MSAVEIAAQIASKQADIASGEAPFATRVRQFMILGCRSSCSQVHMNQGEFEHQLRERGYSVPRIKEFEPNATSTMHTHDFSCLLLVLEGEFTLAMEHSSDRFSPGQVCSLEAGTLHAELAGAEGARILLGTK